MTEELKTDPFEEYHAGCGHDHASGCCGHNHAPEADNCCGHSGHHHHVPDMEDTSGPRLLFTLALNFIIPAAQIVGGLAANSVALISDAIHNFSDFTAILISYIAYRIGKKGANPSNTFGYRRAEIMAALINVLLLTGASGVILYHAVIRFFHPEPVSGRIVMILAGVGVIGNGLSAWLLHRDAAHSLNMRGAFLHMMGDLLTSVAVLINGLLMMYYPWYWLDPLLSLLIVAFILKSGWQLFRESTAVLMNATPAHISLEKIGQFMADIPGVLGVHYLHVWQVSSDSTAFSCHVVVPDQPVSRTSRLSERIRHELLHRFRIDHPVLQFETADCGGGGLLCEMSCNGNTCPPDAEKERSGKTKPQKSAEIHSRLFILMRWVLAIVFLYAGYDKILHPEAFARAVYNYQILPDAAVNLAALILPWLELLIGASLFIGVWLPGATLISTGLLTVFIGALTYNQIRGLDIHCGCFSTEPTQGPAGVWTVMRDTGFLFISLYLTFHVFFTGTAGGGSADAKQPPADHP